MILVLNSTNANISTKRKSSKRSMVDPNSISSIKRIFLLLTKMITIYMQLFKIQIWKPSFEKTFAKLYGALGYCLERL